MIHFFDLTPDTLAAHCDRLGMRRFVADQLMQWVYRHGVTDWDRMTNLSKADRATLQREICFFRSREVQLQQASDGTQKLLLGWMDDDASPAAGTSLPLLETTARQTECVMIPTESRRTACISSQVGCPVGCRFCASGLGGLEGNLTRGQILEQVHRLAQLPGVGRITNIVFMGMGEPLANAAKVTDAIRTLNAPWGFGISARRITISTVGLPQAIRKLVTFEIPVTLALSLHAPTDALRRELIPWSQYTTIDDLMAACQEYFNATGREITLEYILLHHVNDQPEHAKALADVASTLRANVNLIRYNEVRGLPFQRPATEDVHNFQAILRRRGINVHIRASRGRDIAAACGQLRHERRARSA